jgi:hypothetical protein
MARYRDASGTRTRRRSSRSLGPTRGASMFWVLAIMTLYGAIGAVVQLGTNLSVPIQADFTQ